MSRPCKKSKSLFCDINDIRGCSIRENTILGRPPLLSYSSTLLSKGEGSSPSVPTKWVFGVRELITYHAVYILQVKLLSTLVREDWVQSPQNPQRKLDSAKY